MTQEQFIYWLKGYLVNCVTDETLAIQEALDKVRPPYAYELTVSSNTNYNVTTTNDKIQLHD